MRIKIPLQIIELEQNNFHLIIASGLPDGSKGNWVIDTGASRTVFDKNLNGNYHILENESDEIHTAGIGENPMEVSMALIKGVSFESLSIQELKVALLDLSHINELYSKATNMKICGLIGGDFLMKHRAVINYQKKVLILKSI